MHDKKSEKLISKRSKALQLSSIPTINPLQNIWQSNHVLSGKISNISKGMFSAENCYKNTIPSHNRDECVKGKPILIHRRTHEEIDK